MTDADRRGGEGRRLEDDEHDAIRAAVYNALTDHLQDRSCASNCRLSDDDVVFFHRFKNTFDSAAKLVGTAIIMGILGGLAFIAKIGIEGWRRSGQ